MPKSKRVSRAERSIFECRLSSWKDFICHPLMGLIDLPAATDLIFRGHSNANWTLTPSLLRAAGPAVSGGSELILKLEELAREEFAAQAHLFLPSGILSQSTSIVRWWVLMQHYRAPTRLLDWTFSPFVAAYFACIGDQSADGAVWALNVQVSDFTMPPEFDENSNDADLIFLDEHASASSLRRLVHGPRNERMTAQQGVFIFSDQVLSNQEDVLSKLKLPPPTERRWTFGKLIIPADVKGDFLKQLSFMNINARSLFPGIDGLGRSVFEQVMMESLRSK